MELDTENGVLLYEVDIMTDRGIKYKVDIDANSGRAIKVEHD